MFNADKCKRIIRLTMPLEHLKQFRTSVYNILGKAKDALFDLMDAALITRSIFAFVELALSPVFRRKWSSVYEAIQDGNPPRAELMKLYIEQLNPTERIILAGDHTAWARINAPTLKDRTYEHQVQPLSGAKPVTLGQGYSTIAVIPETSGSWALPLLHERITSFENPIQKAATQLKLVCENLPTRPISLWDSEYGCASFINQTSDIPADKLMRLRPNRVLYGAPPPYSGKGRPRSHGDKFKLNDSTTWWTPDETIDIDDPEMGRLSIRLWCNLHFQQSKIHPMNVIQVQRLDDAGNPKYQPLWLGWVGLEMPALSSFWQLYGRRFAIDHWYRFAKQRLHWTLPQLSTPEQCEKWSDLLPLMTWQLWLARDVAADNPLPWQKKQTNLSPGRVAQRSRRRSASGL